MPKLDIEYIDEETVRINGVKFAIEFFEFMARQMVGQQFEVVSRSNETITIKRLEKSENQ